MQSQFGGWHCAHVHLLGQGVVVHKGEFTTDLAIKTENRRLAGRLHIYTVGCILNGHIRIKRERILTLVILGFPGTGCPSVRVDSSVMEIFPFSHLASPFIM